MAVYSNVGFGPLALAALFGLGWGVGSVLFGLGVARVGTALAFAIIISLSAAVGALVPMAVLHPDQIGSARGALLFLGLAIVIVGVTLCSRAGMLKESALGIQKTGSFTRGLVICIASGVTSPMMNFSLAFGSPISAEAARLGANPANASIAILAVAISSGFLVNAGYCLYLLSRNDSWRSLTLRGVLLTILMGFLWMFGMFFYGLGATRLGQYGSVLGWPLFMTVMVLVANLWGILTGEWTGAGRSALRYQALGNAVMIVALVVIALGTRA
jgi:L-rhamnose-H+ transport protein